MSYDAVNEAGQRLKVDDSTCSMFGGSQMRGSAGPQ